MAVSAVGNEIEGVCVVRSQPSAWMWKAGAAWALQVQAVWRLFSPAIPVPDKQPGLRQDYSNA